jgi:hypothetical protein
VSTTYYDVLLSMTLGPIFIALGIMVVYTLIRVRVMCLRVDNNGDGLDMHEFKMVLKMMFFSWCYSLHELDDEHDHLHESPSGHGSKGLDVPEGALVDQPTAKAART